MVATKIRQYPRKTMRFCNLQFIFSKDNARQRRCANAQLLQGKRRDGFRLDVCDTSEIIAIEEKPRHNFLVNAGIYMLDPAILDHVPVDTVMDMTDLFGRLLEAGVSPTVFPVREYWLDIGHMDDFERANNEFATVFKGFSLP